MRTKREILEDLDELRKLIKETSLYTKERRDTFLLNIDTLANYLAENELWGDVCWGTDESVAFICFYVLCSSVATLDEPLVNPKVFYEFIRDWFRDHADAYRNRIDKGLLDADRASLQMVYDCADLITQVLKNN